MYMELPCADYTRRDADYVASRMRRKTTKPLVCTRVVKADGTHIYKITLEENLCVGEIFETLSATN